MPVPRKYKFIFTTSNGKEFESIQTWYRDPEESFDRACALLDFSIADSVRMFEYNVLYDEWYERIDLY